MTTRPQCLGYPDFTPVHGSGDWMRSVAVEGSRKGEKPSMQPSSTALRDVIATRCWYHRQAHLGDSLSAGVAEDLACRD